MKKNNIILIFIKNILYKIIYKFAIINFLTYILYFKIKRKNENIE